MTLTLCIALHLYSAPPAPDTFVSTLHSECSTVTMREAMPIVRDCAQQGAERCEVIVRDRTAVIIERKVTRK